MQSDKNQLVKLKETYPWGFREDEDLTKGLFFRIVQFFMGFWAFFFAFETPGIEKVPKDEGILFITAHSFHNQEVLVAHIVSHLNSGKLCRPLIHRLLYTLFFFMRYLGCIPGERKTAVALLKSRHWLAVVPGGGEEGSQGFENAYKLHWKSSSGNVRRGFAHVAREANVRVVPVAGKNIQEMYFHPVAYLWNLAGLSRAYDRLLQLPGRYGWLAYQVKSVVWLFMSFSSIPIPVKAGMVFGEPLEFQEGESIDAFAQRAHDALQSMIDQHNPGGLNYSRAIKARFNQKND